MKKIGVLVAAVLFGCSSVAYAADNKAKASDQDIGGKTVSAVADTAKSAVSGTANVAQVSVEDTVSTPKTAIQAVKDTANTAFDRTDAAIKTFTGEDSNE